MAGGLLAPLRFGGDRAKMTGLPRPFWSVLVADQPTPPPTRPIADNRDGAPCDLCGAPMLGLHCKLSCQQCGFRRDCSDP
jgi:hypothetical protein